MVVLLNIERVVKRFGGLLAIDHVSFSLNEGEILSLIGPNGSGKTTMVNAISGVFPPDAGKIFLRGEEITGLEPNQICQKGITRTFQIMKPFERLTVKKNIVIGALNRAVDMDNASKIASEVLDFVGLSKKSSQVALNLTTGDRKRLELARALATRPQILLLDEVVSGLNATETNEIIAIVRRLRDQGITILLIEHVMKVIMTLSHRIVVLNQGTKIAEGTTEEISRDPKVIEAYLGKEYKVA